MTLTLRAGGSGDVARIGAIMTAAFDPRYGEGWTPSQCLGMLSLPGVWLTIAAIGDVDVGFAMSRATLEDGELLLLATHPDYRRRGVGGALLRSVITDSQQRKVGTLHLEVRRGNDAIILYRNEGFSQVGERRDYYRGKDGRLYDAMTFARNIEK